MIFSNLWFTFQTVLHHSQYPPIMQDISWPLAIPFKEQRYHRSPSESIGNNYTPTANNLKIKDLTRSCRIHKAVPEMPICTIKYYSRILSIKIARYVFFILSREAICLSIYLWLNHIKEQKTASLAMLYFYIMCYNSVSVLKLFCTFYPRHNMVTFKRIMYLALYKIVF